MIDQKRAIHKLIASGLPFLLVILDACRYDTFAKVNWLKGNLRKAISSGSTTMEWVTKTFTGYYPNLVYLSSIPHIASRYMPKIHGGYRAAEHFYLVVDVWDWGYDQDFGTVMPETMLKAAVQARRDYYDKGIVVHFIQPHEPMVGNPPFTIETWESLIEEGVDGCFPCVEDIVERGYGDYLIKAYEGNLNLVLRAVEELISGWSGKVVITADHGQGFGENGVYGHVAGSRVPELVEVPFFEVE